MCEFKVGDTAFVVDEGNRPYIREGKVTEVHPRDNYTAYWVVVDRETVVKYTNEIYTTRHNALPALIKEHIKRRDLAVHDAFWHEEQMTRCKVERDTETP